jgi:membrane associated rhomboid family serine protease
MQHQPVTFGRRGLGGAAQRTAPPPSVRPVRETLSPAAAPPDRHATAGVLPRVPFATAALLVALALVFALEQSASLEAPRALSPGYRSLIALGGVNARLVYHDGQAWRLLTAAWLHASPSHLIGNGLILLLTGLWLEGLLGRAWFTAVYAVSAVGG